MLVGFRAAVAWNATLLDRQPGNIIAGPEVLQAAISQSMVFVRGLAENLDEFASTVCKTVSVVSLVDVKKPVLCHPTPCQ